MAEPTAAPLSTDVTAQRWWWDMRYNDPVLSNSFTTANEIHIPVGRPVALTLRSMDVIHSFWVPKLHGKKDLIPGQVNTLYPRLTGPAFFAANAPSSAASSTRTWRCTWWRAARRVCALAGAAATARAGAEHRCAAQGRDVFMSSSCVLCHAIAGTSAGGVTGPNLTHVATRPSLAAGTCPTRTRISRVIDPQQHKPGNNMPPNPLSLEDLQALLSYLATLR